MNKKNRKARARYKIWTYYITGGVISLVCLSILLHPSYSHLHVHGPMNTGHEELECSDCHKSERGNLRQQLQANVQYLLGNRTKPVAVGYRAINNRDCSFCHDRPNDRHPVYRFFAPRFRKAREQIQPQYCVSCHSEHTGERVTSDISYCKTCHAKLVIENDPISISHQQLIRDKNWASCLGCHDYHGNHKMELNRDVDRLITRKELQKYFAGESDSPYGTKKFHKARTEL
uniref:Cytochrome c3 n=1 Tax=Candidatus Kentrum sp. MB TaxID=2138164 RepID=A0A451BBQ6_9GAMM|nr:MAG: Cytochrome c3 [Candidatus Kentron sp. MB]VFK33024.1 MAG: Cytochrome c3 [Candidatus Kentron sp. MB]VFK75698.1 MAG: Cytochrome c3 [Candidatus Kentron sp. MB]